MNLDSLLIIRFSEIEYFQKLNLVSTHSFVCFRLCYSLWQMPEYTGAVAPALFERNEFSVLYFPD
jgi:hypothetical protein